VLNQMLMNSEQFKIIWRCNYFPWLPNISMLRVWLGKLKLMAVNTAT
jgi:hypothetical protein